MVLRGRYRILGRVGKGGGGTVWRAEDLCADTTVALKTLFPRSAEEGLVAALRSEFSVLCQLRHPSIAQVFDFGRLPPATELGGPEGLSGYFLTREFLDGKDMVTAFQSGPSKSPRALARLCGEVALALDVLHRAGMRHGDLKPQNVIVVGSNDEKSSVRLIDFGLARAEGESGRAAGTAAYVAPEILREEAVDRRADIYALGIMFAELLLGELPMRCDTLVQMINWHLHGPAVRVCERRSDLSASFEMVTGRLLARNRDARYATAREAAAALFALAGAQLPETPPSPLPLIGNSRTETLANLEELVRERLLSRSAGPSMVLLHGDPGSGKSTLLRELAWRTQLAGIECLTVEFRRGDARPLGSLGTLLEQVAALAGRSSPLSEDLHAPGRFAVHSEIVRFLSVAARKTPLLLLLDGVECSTPDTASVLRYLLHALGDIEGLLIISALTTTARESMGLASAPAVELRPLSSSEVTELLRVAAEFDPRQRIASLHDLRSSELGARVHRHTGGIPAFVAEVATHLVSASGDPLRVPLPANLEESARSRFDRLPASAKRIAEHLAVAGRPVPVEDLTANPNELRALDHAGLIERLPEGVTLRATATGRALLDQIPKKRRQALYREAALQTTGAEACRHWLEAGEIARADRLSDDALTELWARGAHTEAIDLGESLIEVLPKSSRRRRGLELRLSEMARQSGDFTRAIAHAKAAKGPEGAALEARCGVEAGDFSGAIRLLLAAISEHPGRCDLLQILAEAQTRSGETASAEKTCREALSLQPTPSEKMRIHTQLGMALGYLGRADESREELDRALQGARQTSDRAAEIAVLGTQAHLHYRQQDFVAAQARWSEALEVARSVGDVERIVAIELNLATLAHHRGDLHQQLASLERCLSLARAIGAAFIAVQARINLGACQLQIGLVEEAHANADEALRESQRLGMKRPTANAMHLLALTQAARGDYRQALLELQRVEDVIAELNEPVRLGELWADRCDLDLRASQLDEARRTLRRAKSLAVDAPKLTLRLTALEGRILANESASEKERAAMSEALDSALEKARSALGRPLQIEILMAAIELDQARGHESTARKRAQEAMRSLEGMVAGLPPELRNAFWQDGRRRMVREAAQGGVAEADTMMGVRPGAPNFEQRFFRLLEINRQLNSESDPELLLERVMDAAVELTGGERGFLLLERSGGELTVEIARNVESGAIDAHSYSRSIAERAFRQDEPVVAVSAHNDPRFQEYLSVHQMKLESVLAIPLHVRGRRAGVLYLESRFSRGPFTPDDVRLLQAFADQAAIAISNARLNEELSSRASDLERARRELEVLIDERQRLLDRRTHELERAQQTLAALRDRLAGKEGRFGLIGRSEAMRKVFDALERIANSIAPTLIIGESGTGKEMVARAIHENGPRREGPFVAVNCAAIPEQLLESELFGHVRGAFTGADRDRPGLFQAAQGGTLFLDEIGDMPARMQVSLLRTLQEAKVRPVGAEKEVPVDARVIAASQRPLEELVKKGTFREDLFYRLNVVPLRLPPLRERADDIPLLVDHFLEQIATRAGTSKKSLTRAAAQRLRVHAWPGNIRQLEHVVLNATVMQDGELLDVDDLCLDGTSGPSVAPGNVTQRKEVEHREILAALETASWNRTRAAEMVGLPRRTFYRRMREFGIL